MVLDRGVTRFSLCVGWGVDQQYLALFMNKEWDEKVSKIILTIVFGKKKKNGNLELMFQMLNQEQPSIEGQ